MNSNQELHEHPLPSGKLMIIGGAEKKDDSDVKTPLNADNAVHARFLKLIDTKEPVIAVITTAGEEDVNETYETYQRTFSKISSCTTFHIHHNSREEVKEQDEALIAKADAVFFAGGDQLKLTSIYGGTSFLRLIRSRYVSASLVVAGTSAGAMALSTPMIYAGSGEDEMIMGEVKITIGFEFLKDVCIDTHFVHRGRFVRMAQVIATNPACIGMGIEEDTAVIVEHGNQASVCGSGVVILIDGKSHTENSITKFGSGKTLTIRDLKVDILSEGQAFELPYPA